MNAKLRYLAVFVTAVCVLICCIPSFGQVVKGSISGTVVDPQGAVVAGAEIKAKNLETGVVFNTATDSSGLFRLNLLPVGTYVVEVTAKGFKTASHSSIVVIAGKDSGLGSIKMSLGEASTTVEVAAEAPLIETTQAQVTNTFSGTQLNTFAGVQENEGLDNLALFVPGVSSSRSNNFSNSNGGGGFTVDGIRGRNNDQQIDGQNNNDNSVGGPGLFISSPEFVQQYVLITNNFGPEYGRNAGSVVNIITKSGGNAWHGSVFGNETNSFLNALSNTQRRFTKIPPDFHFLTGPIRSNEEYTGGTIGGPILKNKLFIFGGVDDDLFSGSNLFTTNSLTPTPTGLAQLLGCYPNSTNVAALAKFGPFGISGGNPTGTPLPNSNPAVAPAFRSVNVAPGGSFAPCNGVQFGGVMRTVSAPSHGFDWILRTDLQLANDTLMSRYVLNRGNTFGAASSGTAAAAAGYPNNVLALSQAALVGWTHNFSSRMVNEARAGFGRLNVDFGGNSIGPTVPTADGLVNAVANVSFNSTFLGFGPATNIPQSRIVNTWQAQDNWNYVIGKHAFKSGVNWTYQRSPNIFLPTVNGQFRFTNFNSFVANTPNRVQVASGPSSLDFREYDTFAYVGDDWKVKSNLTLNLGLTWSYYGQPANLFNDITSARESNAATAFWRQDIPLSDRIFPSIGAPSNSFGPSVGFAYSPHWGGFLTGDGKTTIRGGYRLLYDPPFYNIYVNISSSAPEVFLQSFTGAQAAALGLPVVPTGPNVRSKLAPQLQKLAFDPRSFAETTIPSDFGPDRVHSWSFGIEREVTKNSAFEVRYVGNKGTNLFQTIDANPLVGAYQQAVSTAVDPSGFVTVHGLLQDFPNLVPAGLSACAAGNVVPGPGQPNNHNQAMGAGRISCDAGVVRSRNNTGYSDYHAVQTEFRANNLFKQLLLRTGYTWSKTTDNVSEIFSTGTAGNTSAFAQNPLNFQGAEHGISGLDFTHRWTIIATEQLPFFKEQHGFFGHLLGGWGFTFDYQLGSGQPYTPVQAFEAQLSEITLPTALPGFGPALDYYDNGFVGAFSGEVARPFSGNPNAPVNSVAIFAGDACNLLKFGFGVSAANASQICAQAPTQLVSLNAINQTCLSLSFGANPACNAVPVSRNDVRFVENTRIASQVFGTPFGDTGRNVLRDAITNIGNASVFKNIRFSEKMSFEFHATALNVFNHFNFTSVDPAILDAGLVAQGTGFADPSLTTANGRRFFVGGRFTF